MATQPVLHLFPPVSHIEKRRDELDDLIKKSLELRPSRQFATAGPGTSSRRVASRSRSRAPGNQPHQPTIAIKDDSTEHATQPQSVTNAASSTKASSLQWSQTVVTREESPVQTRKESQHPQQPSVNIEIRPAFKPQGQAQQAQAFRDQISQPSQLQQSYHPPPLHIQRAATEPPPAPVFDPNHVKTTPLPIPPIDTQNLKRSISRTPPARPRPRRSSSARGHGRLSNGSVATRASTTISPASTVQSWYQSGVISTNESPVTNPSYYGSRYSSNLKFEQTAVQSQQNNRQSVQYPSPSVYSSKSDECLLLPATTLPPPPPPPRSSLRTHTTRTSQITASPPRQTLPRNTHRQQDSQSSTTSWRGRLSTAQEAVPYSQSSASLSRSNTLTEVGSPESYYMPEKTIATNVMDDSIRSMFPRYEPNVPVQFSSYQPQRAAPFPPANRVKHDSSSTGSRSSSNMSILASGAATPQTPLSTLEELDSLWNAANGQITTRLPGPFNLKMFKSGSDAKRKSKITFGPDESQTFYSLAQAHPAEHEEDEAHEALIFRHHETKDEAPVAAQDDLLPISHMLVYPPPAPTYSKSSRHASDAPVAEELQPISTVTPVMATLHALDAAAKSPQAHAIASSDPKAESPAAARLAERAVQAATQRESCTLGWVRTCPRSGKYELHHPSLGVFTVAVEGDVKAALSSISSSTKSRKHASITLLNPFASLTYQSPPIGALSPTAPTFRDSMMAASANSKPQGTLVKLDFSEEVLHIDAPAIQSLGNVYLLDVAVATVLAVAIAESQRADDPGLLFAAPPPSLMLTKAKKSTRIFSSYSSSSSSSLSSSDQTGSASDKKKKKLTSASTVSLVQLVRGTNGRRDGGSSGRRTIDWSRTNAIMGIEHLTDVHDLPRITRGILSVLGLGFKTALWLLEFGVRISAKMVIGLTKFGDKV